MYLIEVDETTYEIFQGNKIEYEWLSFENLRRMLEDKLPWHVVLEEDIFINVVYCKNTKAQLSCLIPNFRKIVFRKLMDSDGAISNAFVEKTIFEVAESYCLPRWATDFYYSNPHLLFDVVKVASDIKHLPSEEFNKDHPSPGIVAFITESIEKRKIINVFGKSR